MSKNLIIGASILTAGLLGFYLANANNEDVVRFNGAGAGAPAGITSTGAPIEAKKEQPLINYNIQLEAPKIPEFKSLEEVKKEMNEQPTSKKSSKKPSRFDLSKVYGETAEVQAVESEAVKKSVGYIDTKPIIDLKTGKVLGYHDTKKQVSVLEPQPYKLEEQPERPYFYDKPPYLAYAESQPQGYSKKEIKTQEPQQDKSTFFGTFIGFVKSIINI